MAYKYLRLNFKFDHFIGLFVRSYDLLLNCHCLQTLTVMPTNTSSIFQTYQLGGYIRKVPCLLSEEITFRKFKLD